ncbi:MAG: LLM class flavin-dependent oxidoreductase [Candidatus Binataceae bacterium]|nr:LLM class flavin-dependent oxidoreductase [Candidatus Binataceae bacterium]
MQLGAFLMPSHPPERPLREAHEWDLKNLEYLDRVGFDEAWIGEHFTAPWEPIVAPDLMIAQAITRTRRIRLGPGGHLLPYYNPAVLAHRIAYLDHLSDGRIMFGVASGGVPTDWRLFDYVNLGELNREKTREAVEIILKIWNEPGPWRYPGKFWNVSLPEPMFGSLKYHVKPLQVPHPPMAIAGLSPKSPTLSLAGEYGLWPLSIAFSHRHLLSHWQSVVEGAVKAGKLADRAHWRINLPVYVAATDAEAINQVLNGPIGRAFNEYLMPLWRAAGLINSFKEDPSAPDDSVTLERMVKEAWLVGSPRTVIDKFLELQRYTGGFGGVLVTVFDHSEPAYERDWFESLRLLAEEVMPAVRDKLAGGRQSELKSA